jgi:flagellar biosynthetic protein FliR
MISFTEAQLSQWLADFFWPLTRVSAMLMAAPVFSVRQVPLRVRLLLAVLITLLVQPILPPAPAVPVISVDGLTIAAQQVLIGIALGFLLQMAFQALVFGGQVMAYSMGLGFAHMMDPANGVQVPVVSQFWLILAMLAFLLTNGHLLLIAALVDTFSVVPIAADGLGRAGLMELLSWASRMFAAGLLMTMPVVIALLLVNIGMGIVSRAAPQLNIFAVGFPVTLMMGFILIWVTLPQVLKNFLGLVDEAFGFSVNVFSGA